MPPHSTGQMQFHPLAREAWRGTASPPDVRRWLCLAKILAARIELRHWSGLCPCVVRALTHPIFARVHFSITEFGKDDATRIKDRASDEGRSPIRGARILAGHSHRPTSGGEAVPREPGFSGGRMKPTHHRDTGNVGYPPNSVGTVQSGKLRLVESSGGG